jgi:hypothetical protein
MIIPPDIRNYPMLLKYIELQGELIATDDQDQKQHGEIQLRHGTDKNILQVGAEGQNPLNSQNNQGDKRIDGDDGDCNH